MQSPLPQSTIAGVEDLFRRHDGPVPADELLATLTGEAAHLPRQRSISRQIDRAALDVGRSIASHRAGLPASRTGGQRHSAALQTLSRCLANYRKLGVSLAGGGPPPVRSSR